MRLYSILLFFVCLNIAAFVLNASGALPASELMYATPTDVTNVFSIATVEEVLTGAGIAAGVAGLVAFFTKQYIFTSAMLMIWVIAMIFAPVSWFLAGFPLMLAQVGAPAYVSAAFLGLFAFVFFMSLIELATPKPITQ